jgi:hypothetical protein
VELVPLDAGRPPAVVTREAAALRAAGAVDVLVRFCTTRAEGLALRELPLHRD